jgi:hypothetical protein
MQYLNSTILCLTYDELFNGLIPVTTYRNWRNRGTVVFHGRGGNGRNVLIEYDSLPEMYKQLVKEVLCNGIDPHEYMAKQPIRDLIKADHKAIQFFQDSRLKIKPERRLEYANDAAILNAFVLLLSDKKKLKQTLNLSLDQFWKTAGTIVKELKKEFPNTLPTSDRRLKPIFKAYKKDGYESLIDGRTGNENNRKVDEDLEALILSLYIQNGKPYAKEVHEIYERFMNGELDVVDVHSGEVFDRSKFVKDGDPITISDTTVWNYINKPINRITVDKFRTSSLDFSSTRRPHMHRHAPVYSFSKISMDDINVPFKMPDGTRVWSYQIFDVTSGCVIGRAFGKEKNRGLFTAAVMDMFRLIINNGWGTPAEIEVEQHISNTFADDLLKDGYLFPFVRFCRGGNPQEKRAEGFIKGKKYQHQAKREGFQRRPFARLEANRMNEDKNKLRFHYDEIVANEEYDIQQWNNSLHPNQEKYAGKTRWQVLCEYQNPQLVEPDLALISQYIGYKVVTSVQRSQKVRVKNDLYQLPSPKVIELLNDLTVVAHYIPDVNGNINQVHLYQDGQFICTCDKLERFNEAKAEQTAEDLHIRNKQFAYVTEFNTMVRDNSEKLARKVAFHANNSTPISLDETLATPVLNDEPIETEQLDDDIDTNDDYWLNKAMNDL